MASSDLTWLLVKKWNSFQVKGIPEGPVFSKEPGNLRNIHSHKYSGLTNPKHIALKDSNGRISVITRKPKAGPHQVKTAQHSTTFRRGGPRRHAGIVSGHARSGYRADLRTSALARLSALSAAQQGPKTPKNEKKSRAVKRAEAKRDAESA